MGIATGLLVGGLISAGTGIGSAVIQSRAAGKAADQQAAAANAATQLQRDIFNQQRADTMPWLRAGQGSVTTLANLMGIPMAAGGANAPPMTPAQMTGTTPRQPTPNAQYTGAVARPRPGSLADVNQMTNSIGMAQLRAPDGSVRYVPEQQVDFFTQKGAVRL